MKQVDTFIYLQCLTISSACLRVLSGDFDAAEHARSFIHMLRVLCPVISIATSSRMLHNAGVRLKTVNG